MRQIALIAAAIASFLTVPAATFAQSDDRVEILAGATFPLTAQRFEIDNATAFDLGIAVRVKGRFFLGARYEALATEDDIGRQGDADLDLYGLTASFDLNDDPDLRILGLVAVGQGELEWMNPGPPDPVLADSTDIDLWYEAGVAVEFSAGQRWLFRLGLAARQVRPETPSVLLPTTRMALVPSFDIGIRF